MEKHTYDVRGRQSSILRLYNSDKEGFIHMVFYRAAIIFSMLTLLSMIWSLWSSGSLLNRTSEAFVVVLGILFTPQLFESIKAFSLIMSGGTVFGRLNQSFLEYAQKKGAAYELYKVIPYIVLVVWVMGVVWLGILWFG